MTSLKRNQWFLLAFFLSHGHGWEQKYVSLKH